MPSQKTLLRIATGITTLDEARYFAAMGMDWLGFDADRMPMQEISAIADWVVGPQCFVEIDAIDPDLLFEISQKDRFTGICVAADIEVPEWYSGLVIRRMTASMGTTTYRRDIVLLPVPGDGLSEHFRNTLEEERATHKCWVEISANEKIVLSTLADLPVDGIAMRCVPGAETFEHYDAMLDAIAGLTG